MRDKGGTSVHAACVWGAAKAGCSTALFSRQAGSSSLSESMKESEGSERLRSRAKVDAKVEGLRASGASHLHDSCTYCDRLR